MIMLPFMVVLALTIGGLSRRISSLYAQRFIILPLIHKHLNINEKNGVDTHLHWEAVLILVN